MQCHILQQESTTCSQCTPCAGTAAVAAKAAAAQVAVVRHCGISPKQSQDRACKCVKRAMQGAAGRVRTKRQNGGLAYCWVEGKVCSRQVRSDCWRPKISNRTLEGGVGPASKFSAPVQGQESVGHKPEHCLYRSALLRQGGTYLDTL